MVFDYPKDFPEQQARELLGSLEIPTPAGAASLARSAWAVYGYVAGLALPPDAPPVPVPPQPVPGLRVLAAGTPAHAHAVGQLQAAIARSAAGQLYQIKGGVSQAVDWKAILALAFSVIQQLLPLLGA